MYIYIYTYIYTRIWKRKKHTNTRTHTQTQETEQEGWPPAAVAHIRPDFFILFSQTSAVESFHTAN